MVLADAVARLPAAQFEHGIHLPQAADVVDQVPDPDRCHDLRGVGEILADIVVERELPFLCEQHNTQTGHLFGHRPNVRNRLRTEYCPRFQVCHAEAFGIYRLSPLGNAQRQARPVRPVYIGKKGFDLRDFVRPHYLCPRMPREKYAYRQQPQ